MPPFYLRPSIHSCSPVPPSTSLADSALNHRQGVLCGSGRWTYSQDRLTSDTPLWDTNPEMPEPDTLLDRPDLAARFSGIGVGIGAVAGGIVGLIIGLLVYPATAWFAAIEVGAPTAVLCGVGGLVTSLVIKAIDRSGPG